MNFLIRSAKESDVSALYDLAGQFSLLNLPADRKTIAAKVDKSLLSFSGELSQDKSEYLFVAEEISSGQIAGSSQIKAKHGTIASPTYSFEVLKKERFSKDLGVGFIHQILRLKICEDGPTEVGGLVVDKNFRRRPEKVGKLTSLNRFLYIGMNKDKFSKDLHSEMAPPLTDEGRSEFWEALGRRFTGMPYQEADTLSHQNKEFIRSLFPEEDIYLCLLDAQARIVLGRVSPETQPALHLLESLGFKYKDEVDPFDGGPHLSAARDEIPMVKEGKYVSVHKASKGEIQFTKKAQVAVDIDSEFKSGASHFAEKGGQIFLPEKTFSSLGLEEKQKIYFYESLDV